MLFLKHCVITFFGQNITFQITFFCTFIIHTIYFYIKLSIHKIIQQLLLINDIVFTIYKIIFATSTNLGLFELSLSQLKSENKFLSFGKYSQTGKNVF